MSHDLIKTAPTTRDADVEDCTAYPRQHMAWYKRAIAAFVYGLLMSAQLAASAVGVGIGVGQAHYSRQVWLREQDRARAAEEEKKRSAKKKR